MKILVVGDSHANKAWMLNNVFTAAATHDVDLILQVGDFGFWPRLPGGLDFIKTMKFAPVPVWFLRGNHEDHPGLFEYGNEPGIVEVAANLYWLPDGTPLDFDGVSGLVCGGAHSIDKNYRKEGINYFESEEITDEAIEMCRAQGQVDILFSHDAPAGYRIPGLMSDDLLPYDWATELPACHDSRMSMLRVAENAKPKAVIHGHYHRTYCNSVAFPWGKTTVVGLNCDGMNSKSMLLLDCTDGEATVIRTGKTKWPANLW